MASLDESARRRLLGCCHRPTWFGQGPYVGSVPGAGHFVQHGAEQLVSTTIKWWLLARTNY
jgi:hypothetical protein